MSGNSKSGPGRARSRLPQVAPGLQVAPGRADARARAPKGQRQQQGGSGSRAAGGAAAWSSGSGSSLEQQREQRRQGGSTREQREREHAGAACSRRRTRQGGPRGDGRTPQPKLRCKATRARRRLGRVSARFRMFRWSTRRLGCIFVSLEQLLRFVKEGLDNGGQELCVFGRAGD